MTVDLRLVPAALIAWLTCAVAVGLPARAAVVGAGVALVAAGAVAALRGPPAVWLALAAAALAGASCAVQLAQRDAGPLTALAAEGAAVTMEGLVRSEPSCAEADCRPYVVLAGDAVVGRGAPGGVAARVLLVGDVADLAYGARVRIAGTLSPGEPGDDVHAVLRLVAPPEVLAAPTGVDAVVGRIRRGLLAGTDDLPPDLRGLVPGAAIGDTTRIPADLDRAMRDVGLTHITAVSGSHFAVLSVAVLGAAAVLRLPRVARALAVGLAMAGFVALVHPQPSVVRAAVMGVLAVAGLVVGRPARTVPALAGAVLLLVLTDPWLARSYGFVLSVVATAAIALLAPVVAARLGSVLPRWLAVAVAVPLAAQAACAPVLVLLDPAVSLAAVPANLAAAPALMPATVLGVAGAVTAPWCPWLAALLLKGAAASTWWIAGVARVGAALPGARQSWPGGVLGALALALVTAAALALVLRPRWWRVSRRPLTIAGLMLLVLVPVVRWATEPPWAPTDWAVVMCDVGQGDTLVVRSGDGAAVVVDTGPPGDAADGCLRSLGVERIDLLVLTHFHADHVGGLPGVLHGRTVAAALVSPLTEPAAEAATARAALASAGVPVAVAGGDGAARGTAGEVSWRVLGPPAGAVGPNDASVVLLLERPGVSVLALGDAGPDAQEALARRLVGDVAARAATVVKMAHHGSAEQSTRLAALLSPSVVLVGVGLDNGYGHPTAQALELYRGRGAAVLCTSVCGPVAVGTGEQGLTVPAACLAGARGSP